MNKKLRFNNKFMKGKKISLLVLVIILCQSLYSQNTFDSGYIITYKKDTIHGFILSGMDSELANKVSFKSTLNDDTIIIYSADDLAGFGFNSGRFFERKKIENINHPSKDSSFVFAKRIVKGKIDLFVWRHKKHNSTDFFIRNNSSKREAHLSKTEDTQIKRDGKVFSQKDSKYINKLTFVKQDEVFDAKKPKSLSFGEKPISKDIISYNKNFQEEYPIEIYKEPYKYNYDILVGIPLDMKSTGRTFTISAYRSKTYLEKSNTLSFIYGLSYYDWKDNDKDKIKDYKEQNAYINYIWQKLNIMPLGVKFQTNGKNIVPYAYFSAGVAVLKMTDYVFEDYEFMGSKKEYILRPAIHAGIGTKVRLRSNFLLAEITPAMNTVFIKLGYSF